MSRTNPIALLLGIFFVTCLVVTWLWAQRVGSAVQLWATWAILLYGCVIGFYTWLHGLRCARLIHDVPLSNIGTAAQGYTPRELAGHYYWWLTVGLVMFFGCGAIAASMVTNHVLR